MVGGIAGHAVPSHRYASRRADRAFPTAAFGTQNRPARPQGHDRIPSVEGHARRDHPQQGLAGSPARLMVDGLGSRRAGDTRLRRNDRAGREHARRVPMHDGLHPLARPCGRPQARVQGRVRSRIPETRFRFGKDPGLRSEPDSACLPAVPLHARAGRRHRAHVASGRHRAPGHAVPRHRVAARPQTPVTVLA